MQQISGRELADWLVESSRNARSAPVMLDVREPWEMRDLPD